MLIAKPTAHTSGKKGKIDLRDVSVPGRGEAGFGESPTFAVHVFVQKRTALAKCSCRLCLPNTR